MTIDPRILDPGEKVLWSGKPIVGDFAARSWWPCLFGIFFASTACWIAYGNYDKGGIGFIIGCGFILVGTYTALTPVWKLLEARNTTYALTNRRAITDVTGLTSDRRSVPLHQIRFIDAQLSNRKNVGNVYFRDVASADGESAKRDGFISVTDAQTVERLLRKAIESLPDKQTHLGST